MSTHLQRAHGHPFNVLEYPSDIVLLIVLWRLRYKVSLRDLAEMFLERGFVFTQEAVRQWEERFAPLLTERPRAKRRGKAVQSWSVDETYIRVRGRWCYLYRAIDRAGNLVDLLLKGIKQRYYPLRGFGSFEAAARCCTVHDDLRDSFRPRRTLGEAVSLAEQRQLLRDRWVALLGLIAA